MNYKADYVRQQGQTRDHHCHWPGCDKQVPPAMWGCKKHWYKLPKSLREKIWMTYRPGQELSQTPSKMYLLVAAEVQRWIHAQSSNAQVKAAALPKAETSSLEPVVSTEE